MQYSLTLKKLFRSARTSCATFGWSVRPSVCKNFFFFASFCPITGATTVDLEMTDDVSNVGVGDEDVTKESYYNRGVQRMDMEQQEMSERSSLDRAGVG